MPFRESLACGLQKCVGNQWTGNDYSDFNIIVEDTTFKCHRFILSACSRFFQGMLKSPMKEQIEGRAKLEGLTANTFEIIINAVYTGVEELSSDNVLDVWSASEMLQIDYLTKQCHKFVMDNISVDTCFRFLKHATLYYAQTVVDYCLNFISRRFTKFISEDKLLQLPFDQFYKVISNDYLATDREELVVEAILNWIKYAPRSAQSTSLDSGSTTGGIHDINGGQCGGDSSTNSLTNRCSHENVNDDRLNSLSDVTTDCRNTCTQIIKTRENANKHAAVPVQCINASPDINTDETETENRKQHLIQLLSASRLFRVKSNFLDNIIKNNVRLLVDTGAFQLIHEALMYTLNVSRRHDAWPDAALYRASSEFKHAMMFLSNDKLMAYNLNTGCVVELAKLPDNYITFNFIMSVFDNVLYLVSNNYGPKQFYMLEAKKTWKQMNTLGEKESIVLLPQGNNIYYCCISGNQNTDCSLLYFTYAHGHVLKWTTCCKLTGHGNCLVRFHKNILVFCTKDDVITVECYNTETAKIHKCTTSMSGTSQDMVSFTHRGEVYILQRNGALWKVFSTDMNPVDFELVCKLWYFDCSLKGCMLYRKKLFIFCNSKHPEPTLTSLPGFFTNIRIINIDSTKTCLPMALKLT